jgi:hypothetical protein
MNDHNQSFKEKTFETTLNLNNEAFRQRTHSAFDPIHAEDDLKTNTLCYLRKEIGKRSTPPVKAPAARWLRAGRYVAMTASLAVVLLIGIFSYGLYFTPSAYIDVDVNPSIELTLNRFGRVVDSYAYNRDGDAILAMVRLTHMDYKEAIDRLFTTMTDQGYNSNDSYISVTLSDKTDPATAQTETVLLAAIETVISQHHGNVQVDAVAVEPPLRDAAHELNLSPSKYIAIQELMAVDPTTTYEGCRGHTISELNQLTDQHSGGQINSNTHGHNGNGAINNGSNNNGADSDANDTSVNNGDDFDNDVNDGDVFDNDGDEDTSHDTDTNPSDDNQHNGNMDPSATNMHGHGGGRHGGR